MHMPKKPGKKRPRRDAPDRHIVTPTSLAFVLATLFLTAAPSADAFTGTQGALLLTNAHRTFRVEPARLPLHLEVSATALPDDEGGSAVSSKSSNAKKLLERVHLAQGRLRAALQSEDFVVATKSATVLLDLHTTELRLLDQESRLDILEQTDRLLMRLFEQAFVPPHKNSDRIFLAFDLLNKQLNSRTLKFPYNTVPRRILVEAMKALCYLSGARQEAGEVWSSKTLAGAVRILQRLITGVGVRQRNTYVIESDFVRVLNACANTGQMDIAHKIIALLERNHLPLSAVVFSVLLKGYGKLGQLDNVERVWDQVEATLEEKDTILMNTLMDAYVNCRAQDKAVAVLASMWRHEYLRPNVRSYNTVLKGFARSGDLKRARALVNEMRKQDMWDAVSTNTLVRATLQAKDFVAAERTLEDLTIVFDTKRHDHPNIEAYTDLIDSYAKAGDLLSALGLFRKMQRRSVIPNEVTFTCLMGAFGRSYRLDLAEEMLGSISAYGIQRSVKLYNALISGLLQGSFDVDMNTRVVNALDIVESMKTHRIKPNTITTTALIDALCRSQSADPADIEAVCQSTLSQSVDQISHPVVLTSLVGFYGKAGDMKLAIKAFQKIKRPDTTAMNAFLDACSRCDQKTAVVETFNHFTRVQGVRPDVISFSTVISTLLKKYSETDYRRARNLYRRMKSEDSLQPDTKMIDVVLKKMLDVQVASLLQPSDVKFVVEVLKDAERLQWENKQLERRKRAVRAVLGGSIRSLFGKDIVGSSSADNELFDKKGWNQVDSGFRLWGQDADGGVQSYTNERQVDEFLQSHGWNDVDSGFRLF